MIRPIGISIAVMAIFGSCGKDQPQGVPPAKDWQPPAETATPTVTAPPADQRAGNPPGGTAANPHGGMTGDPHAGMGDLGDMGDMGGDTPAHATPGSTSGPPVIVGTITVAAEVAGKVGDKPVVFISVRRADPASGEPVGPPLATDKVEVTGFPARFELGGAIDGEVVVTAWSDSDRDAISKQPGDVIGNTRVKVPARAVEVALDTVIE